MSRLVVSILLVVGIHLGLCVQNLGLPLPKNKPIAHETAPTQANVKYGSHERNGLDLWLAKREDGCHATGNLHSSGRLHDGRQAARQFAACPSRH